MNQKKLESHSTLLKF